MVCASKFPVGYKIIVNNVSLECVNVYDNKAYKITASHREALINPELCQPPF